MPNPAPRIQRPSALAANANAFVWIILVCQLIPPPLEAGTLAKRGRWWASGDLGVQGTHVTLLREPQTNFAKVFLFGGAGSAQVMKVWRFNPLAGTAWVPSVSSSDANNKIYPVAHPNNKLVDLFCGGHSTLQDGRLLVLGGQWAPTDPCQMAWSFDPRWYPDTTTYAPWSQLASMAVDRWYPTATALSDGRILASSGWSRLFMLTFGGDSTSGKESRVLHPLAMAGRFNWSDTTAIPDVFGVTNGQRPAAREDHVLVGDRAGRVFLIGGRTGTVGAGYSYFNDVWQLTGSGAFPTQDDSTFRWSKCMVYPDPVNGLPAARARFTATWSGLDDWSQSNPTQLHKRLTDPPSADSIVVYIHGGIDANGNALGDLWRGWRRDTTGFYIWQWQKLRDDASTARYGHTMVYDPGPVKGLTYPDHARLLLFGGRDNAGLVGNGVLACRIATRQRIGEGWYLPAMIAGPYGTPPAREGHVAVMQVSRLVGTRRMYVFGGQDGAGAVADTALWYLQRPDAALSDTVYQWARTPRIGGPSGRTRATAGWFDDTSALVMFGGDTNGNANSGNTNEVWEVQLHPSIPAYGTWSQPYLRHFAHPDAPALAGSASWIASGAIATRHMEALDPTGTSGSGSGCTTSLNGRWSTVTSQSASGAQLMSLYPQLYVLPDGRLFHAGPAPAENAVASYRRFFDLGTKQWTDNAGSNLDAEVFGSSVMYRPGKVLRAGSHGEGDGSSGSERTETIDIATGAMPAWQVYTVNQGLLRYRMLPRTNHNLTVLPTGDILASGGRAAAESTTAQRQPQIFDVTTGGWNNPDDPNDPLASDPKPRNYHSSAILLPDARVLTSGGEGLLNDSKFTASIYEPPYLFRGSDDSYSARPGLKDGPENLPYGKTLTFSLTDSNLVSSVSSVALVRPGSATHGFDQNQRYVPLAFAWADTPKRLLVQTPAAGTYAPPGEYMLFVVANMAADATRVPSIAKWVRLPYPSTTVRDSLDAVAPRGGSWLALADVSPCNTNADLYLSWNAPADDDLVSASGAAGSYNLRYKQNSDPNPNFNSWIALGTNPPSLPLTGESQVISGLSSAVWYRFQVKAVGDNADTSLISNALVTKVQYCDPGGGFSARHAGAGAFGAQSTGGPTSGNTTFPGATPGVVASDALQFEGAPRLVAGSRLVTLHEGGARGLSLDRVRLLGLDHSAGTEVVATSDGRFVAGQRMAAVSVHDGTGRDLLAEASGIAAEPVYADSGALLDVGLPAARDTSERYLLLETSAGGGPTEGVTIESAQGAGGWLPIANVHPRQHWSTLAVPVRGQTDIRLRFHGAHALRYAGLLDQATVQNAQQAALLSATSGDGADWTDEARMEDGIDAVVLAGDTLSLAFGDLAPAAGTERTWFLMLDGMPVSASAAAYQARRVQQEHGAMTSFRLHQNIPNPFQRSTRIAFDLPRGGEVKLEVFDTQGRRVWSHSARYAPGRHGVDWNLRDRGDRAVAPGIYSYRLVAGAHMAVRKLVVMP